MTQKNAKRRKLEHSTRNLEWTNLPEKIRSRVIEYLDLPSKAKMSRCSKMCYKAILSSKSYIKSIKFIEDYMNSYQIHFEFFDDEREFRMDYLDIFEEDEDDESMYEIKFNISGEKIHEWEIKRFDVFNKSIQIFQKLIDNSKYLKQIEIDCRKNVLLQHFNFENLEHLETLRIYDLRDDRETLEENGFQNFGLLSKIQKNIICPVNSINLDELLQVRARKSKLYDVRITPKVLMEYIKAVAGGKIDQNVKKIRLDYNKNQEPWDPQLIFDEDQNLKIDVLNKETDPEMPKAIWFDLQIRGKPERYAKFRITEKSFLMLIRLQEKRDYYRERAIEYQGEVENDDELRCDSYNDTIADFDRDIGAFEFSDFEF